MSLIVYFNTYFTWSPQNLLNNNCRMVILQYQPDNENETNIIDI
jgi:hypothetical protein